MGPSACLAKLGLAERALHDAQGNRFDRHAIALRFQGPLTHWLRAASSRRPRAPRSEASRTVTSSCGPRRA
eukprot:11222435-Lingulodinium_polyedra.AAC.1